MDDTSANEAGATNMNTVVIENVVVEPLNYGESLYLKPFRMHFLQNKKKRSWDFMRVLDSVAILIYNPTRDVLVFVKQFRPPVYVNSAWDRSTDLNSIDWSQVPASQGVTLELCAGVIDKQLPVNEIAKEEVLEECGYDVPLEKLQLVTTFRNGVGDKSSKGSLFYVEVDDQMKVAEGGGNCDEGEFIQVVEMTIPEIESYINQKYIQSPGDFLFAISWFLRKHTSTKSN